MAGTFSTLSLFLPRRRPNQALLGNPIRTVARILTEDERSSVCFGVFPLMFTCP